MTYDLVFNSSYKSLLLINKLDVDNAYISKMESNDKPVSKAYLSKWAHVYSVEEYEPFTLGLADKVYDVVKDQDVALKAMAVAEEEIKNKRKCKKLKAYKLRHKRFRQLA